MNILLLGNNYFRRALLELGHEVVWAGRDQACDVQVPRQDPDVAEVLKELPWRPDVILLTDDLGCRVLPQGLDKVDIFKAWYAVDSPINYFWQKHYAPLFDLVLVDQKDFARRLSETTAAPVTWLPVAVDTSLYQGPPEAKLYDLALVGVINPRVRPKRSRIIDLLSRKYTVHTAGGRQDQWVSPGEAARLYRRARLVLNENLFNGVTTRMFEALAAGGCLLTEAGQNGLTDLFQPGQDLVLFTPENLLDQVDFHLRHDAERERISARGREKVLAAHDIRHRAATLIELLNQVRLSPGSPAGGILDREQGQAVFLAGLRWPRHDGLARVLRAEELLTAAVAANQADAETYFDLGLIAEIRGDGPGARQFYTTASEAGSIRALLALGFLDLKASPAAAGQHFRAAARLTGLDFPSLAVSSEVLSAGQHLALGQILAARGFDFTPGFSRTKLPLATWLALEHYQAAARLDPSSYEVLETLGDLLIRQGAFTEAYPFLKRAAELSMQRPDLAEKASLAARAGYIS